MCDFFIIPIHKAHKVLFVKGADINAWPIVETIYKLCIFNNQHPFGSTIFYQVICKPLLVFSGKFILVDPKR